MRTFKVTVPYRLEVEVTLSLPDEYFDNLPTEEYFPKIRDETNDNDVEHPAISKAFRVVDKFRGEFCFLQERLPPRKVKESPLAVHCFFVNDPYLPGAGFTFAIGDHEILEEDSVVVNEITE